MSSQGSNSNHVGIVWRDQVAQVAIAAGLTCEKEVRRYPDLFGAVLRHDLVVTTPTGEVVVECKWHGAARGSIGQKLAYTVIWMGELPVPVIIVYGGEWPQTIVDRCRVHAGDNVKLMTIDQFKVWAYGQNRR